MCKLKWGFSFTSNMGRTGPTQFGLISVASGERFHRWFRKSRMVNRDGTPQVLYHGTYENFDVFQTRAQRPEFGFHFGSLSQAEFLAGVSSDRPKLPLGCIMPVYLRLENPLRIYDLFERGSRSIENILHWLCRDGVLDREVGRQIARARSIREAGMRLARAIEAQGYDGLAYANEWEGGDGSNNEDSYVVFRPEQIKSVYNCGTFDLSRSCILE